jgi:hypothetical protein
MRRLAALALLALPSVALAGTRWLPTESAEATRQKLDRAVEEGAAGVSWLYRPIARSRLAPVATACPAYTFAIDGDRFRVHCEGRDPFEWTVGVTGPWTDPDGQARVVSLTRSGTSYTLVIENDQGGKRWVYAFAGSSLTVTQEVFSPHLSVPMRWTLTYREHAG